MNRITFFAEWECVFRPSHGCFPLRILEPSGRAGAKGWCERLQTPLMYIGSPTTTTHTHTIHLLMIFFFSTWSIIFSILREMWVKSRWEMLVFIDLYHTNIAQSCFSASSFAWHLTHFHYLPIPVSESHGSSQEKLSVTPAAAGLHPLRGKLCPPEKRTQDVGQSLWLLGTER